ncbi:hypothetical protein C0J52_03858 [Blattella germanica]|nr:hypothetical protein C0J52_03858 [Blattella germanica]
MAVFDALLSKVWQMARQEADFLTTFARLTDDRLRVEKILPLPDLESLQVTDAYSGKCETRAEDLLVLGDVAAAIRTAPPGTSTLAQSYYARSRNLLQAGNPDLALLDARRALALRLPQQDEIKLLCIVAACQQQRGAAKLAEQSFNEALDKLRKSDLQNDVKATLEGEIVPQLKKISVKKLQQQKAKRAPDPGAALPELTYGKNASIPAASAALRLCESTEKGRYMTATRDIKLGSVLIVEQPYAWTLSQTALFEHCLHCCGYVVAPVPCNHCATFEESELLRKEPCDGIAARSMGLIPRQAGVDFLVTKTVPIERARENRTRNILVCFCSESCRDAAWLEYHHLECSVLDHILKSTELSKMAWLVYRTVVKALISNTDFTSVTSSSSTPQPFRSDDYVTVWGQVTHAISRTPADVLKRTASAIFLASLLRHVTPQEIDLVTTSALMLHHLQSCSCNAYQITEQVVPDSDVRKSVEVEIGGAVYPTVSLCNHSCNPNVARHSTGYKAVVRAIRNIKKGDEILDNYGSHFLSDPVDERQKVLNSQYFFTCSCEACSNKWPTVDNLNSSESYYKCVHCSSVIGNSLNGLKSCPNCKKKFDFHKIGKRLEFLSREYAKALENLLQRKLNPCLKTCVEYCELLDSVTAHPNKQFVSCQQAITLCWSLMGNARNT